MKIIRIYTGRWEWSIRIKGMIGQAYGISPSREVALLDALNILDHLMDQKES